MEIQEGFEEEAAEEATAAMASEGLQATIMEDEDDEGENEGCDEEGDGLPPTDTASPRDAAGNLLASDIPCVIPYAKRFCDGSGKFPGPLGSRPEDRLYEHSFPRRGKHEDKWAATRRHACGARTALTSSRNVWTGSRRPVKAGSRLR